MTAHLADVAAGTTFGTFVHSVLERLDFTSPSLTADLRETVLAHASHDGLKIDVEAVVRGLVEAIRTPLGPLFSGRSLADISPRDRLAELTFDMPIAAALASPAGRAPARAIAEILLRTLSPDDPIRSFATELAGQTTDLEIAGWMNGSIDGVLRIPHADHHRYVVIDYKTNRLHVPGAGDPLAAYHPQLLVAAMAHHRYPLQALLYSVAVHRYLRWRLGDAYDPDLHLGGVAYLFVRGMAGPRTPTVNGVAHGVFSWRPPTATIVALDQLFATGGHA